MATFAAGAALAALPATMMQAAPFPPINATATSAHIPGKLVWADLFTSQPDQAIQFYTSLFGWTSQNIDQKGRSYTVFSNNGTPVAGLVRRSNSAKGASPSRWIGYLSVQNIRSTVDAVKANGGKVHAPVRKFPDRGTQAIISDNEGNPIGLLESSSGDPADVDTTQGSWNWFEIYVSNPPDAATFYRTALGYDVSPETHSDRKSDFILASNGNNRGGIAPIPAEASGATSSWLGVIRVNDIDAAVNKTSSLGGEVLVNPKDAEFGSRFAIIADPTGGTIGLVQYVEDNDNPAKSQ
jgi:hypothetical protein